LEASEGADVLIACGGTTSGEYYDRKSMMLDQHDFLNKLANVMASRKLYDMKAVPLVVLTMSSSAVLTDFAAAANAVISGDVNPTGKLPVTFPLSEADTHGICLQTDCEYDDGLDVGWRGLIGKPVAFPFGHGLSYTTFSYLWVDAPKFDAQSETVTMSVLVNNTGSVLGAEVAQLYLSFPVYAGEPDLVLRGFQKTSVLQPGGSEHVVFKMTSRDVSMWRDCNRLAGPRFLGCYKDDVSDRDLRVQMPEGDKASCMIHCADFEYFGRQFESECFCGNSYGKHGIATGCLCNAYNIGGSMNCVYQSSHDDGSACTANGWHRIAGEFKVMVGSSSRDPRLTSSFVVP